LDITPDWNKYGTPLTLELQPRPGKKDKVRGTLAFTLSYSENDTSSSEVMQKEVALRSTGRSKVRTDPNSSLPNYLDYLALDLVFAPSLIYIIVKSAKYKNHITFGRVKSSTYVTVTFDHTKVRTECVPNNLFPKYNFSVIECISSLGTKENPAMLEIALWNKEKSGLGNIIGMESLPLVNFADNQNHDFQLSLRDQFNKETGWVLHLNVKFHVSVETLKKKSEVDSIFEDVLVKTQILL